MIRFSIQPRDRKFVKGYVFLSFAKNMGKNIGKNISKNLSSRHSPGRLAVRNCLIMLNNLQPKLLPMFLKLLQKEQFKQ